MYDDTPEIKQDRPPAIEEAIHNEIMRLGLHKLREFPRPIDDAIKFWISKNEPATYHEAPRQVSVMGNKGAQRWICPYHERLINSLRGFFVMTEQDRQCVLNGIDGGIPYRGDSIEFYKSVVAENARMMEMGVSAYRREALKQMRKVV